STRGKIAHRWFGESFLFLNTKPLTEQNAEISQSTQRKTVILFFKSAKEKALSLSVLCPFCLFPKAMVQRCSPKQYSDQGRSTTPCAPAQENKIHWLCRERARFRRAHGSRGQSLPESMPIAGFHRKA